MSRWIAAAVASMLFTTVLVLTGGPASGDSHHLFLSSSPDRSASIVLDGVALSGDAFVFVSPETDVRRVSFYIDDPTQLGSAEKVENRGPFDLAGTNGDGTAKPFSFSALGPGSHTVTAVIAYISGGTSTVTSTVTVTSDGLVFDQTNLDFTLGLDSLSSASLSVTDSNGGAVAFTVTDDAGWLSSAPAAGTTPATVQIDVDTAGLAPGQYAATITASAANYGDAMLGVSLTVAADYQLLLSLSPDRSSPVDLNGSDVEGDIYVYLSPEAVVSRVLFYVDDPTRSGPATKSESRAPFDLAGTAGGGLAKPFDTAALGAGPHSLTALVELDGGGSQLVTANFAVGQSPFLQFDQPSVAFALFPDATSTSMLSLSTSTGDPASFSIAESAAWLTATPATGSTPSAIDITVDSTGLAPGTYSETVVASAPGQMPASTEITLTVNAPSTQYDLLMSLSPDRSASAALDGQTANGDIYVFTSPDVGVTRVEFYLDDPGQVGSPYKIEQTGPFDLGGSAIDGSALPFDASLLATGDHTLTAVISATGFPDQVVSATFSVASGTQPAVIFDSAAVPLIVDAGQTVSGTVGLSISDGSALTFTVADDAPWLTVTPSTGSAPAVLTVQADATALTDGSYQATITATAPGADAALLPVSLVVGSPECLPLTCGELLVTLPYTLDFSSDAGRILDGAGSGTGLTYVQQTSSGIGYLPSNLSLDTGSSTLAITSTAGLATSGINTQDNTLGVGIDAASQVSVLSTTIINPPAGTNSYEQGGLWFGTDEDNYVKAVVQSTPSGPRVEFLVEVDGIATDFFRLVIADPTTRRVNLQVITDPGNQTITGGWSFDNEPINNLGTATVPPEFFSFDAAGINPEIGTRSFGGIFGSHRNGPSPVVYTFDYFSAVEQQGPPPAGATAFEQTVIPVPSPTSLAWGPDGRLYVSELFGRVHALTLDANQQVTDDEVINTIRDNWGGNRLTLGIEIDPASTPTDVILWVGHSDGSVNNGAANSGAVTRLSGPGFATFNDVITGLPRAIANHGLNSIHFGPDGRLYLAAGGSTGAGAPNDAGTEFGTRPEQPLSAALLVADVNDAGFQGNCASSVDDATGTADKVIPATCDVSVYASGLRNMYDFVFHSNGEIYGPDNGLGVSGTVPPIPAPDCQGIVPYGAGEFDPGQQTDPLVRIAQGAFYGHPNPARDECVFGDGSFQGVAPPANYSPAITNLGLHRSANGIIEYSSDRRCGSLQGALLIANYSQGDDLSRVILSPDGQSVVSIDSLVGGFSNPLPLVEGANGVIYVGEIGGQVIALTPNDIGCWRTEVSAPASLLDVSGAVLNDIIYLVAGKTSSGPQSTTYTFDPGTDTWSTVADLPGPGVENAAVVAASDGRLYAFGGSTSPFSGAVDNSASFDPTTGNWTSLTTMPTARGGATVSELNGLLYVSGGMGADGASVDVVEVYDPVANTWSSIAPMGVRRDNPGSAALNGMLYVFGGRTRNADSTEVNGTLASVEMFDPATGTWSARAPMPTGRRTFATAVLNGRALVVGGEKTPAGGVFPANEEYDPVTDTWQSLESMLSPRHGGAAAVVGDRLYVIGGGTQGGGSYSDINESFAFETP